MGPSLAEMAKRASDVAGVKRRVIGVARFSSEGLEERLQNRGIETIRCDLLDPVALERLPQVPNLIYMVGRKFGSTGQEPYTWAINAYLPGLVCRHFRNSRILAFSTGNVYGMTPVRRGGSRESDPMNPQGEYAMSCLARERIFEHQSLALGIPSVLIRLNYATELRYGVLVDIAQRVARGEPIDLTMGYVNAIWQGDANAMALQAFGHAASPPFVLNVAGTQLSVRAVASRFAELLGKEVRFEGVESDVALLSNAEQANRLFGPPRVETDSLLTWIADWIQRGGETLDKPTHYEVRDGRF